MIGSLPPGDWHFAGGYNAVQVGDIEKLRKENEMPNIRKEFVEKMDREVNNIPPWIPKETKLVCGACGETLPYGAINGDIVIIHACKRDREYLETMKRIAFKLLGIEDPDEYIKRMQSMMPQVGQWNSVQMPEIMTEKEARKELGLE